LNKQVNVRKEVMKSVVDLIRHKVFYGHILQQLTKVYEGHPIKTMGVGKRGDEFLIKLYVNKKYVQRLWSEAKREDEAWQWLMGVLEHEVLHIVFNHLSMKFSDKLRGNVAVDLVVNSCINRSSLPPKCVFPDMYGFESHKSSSWYYERLKDNDKFKEQCASGAFGPEGILSDASGAGHELWGEASMDPLLDEFVRDLVAKAKDLCGQDYGSIPGHVIEQIDKLLGKKKPIIPWNKVLRNFAASAMESNLDYTMKRISKRFGTRPGTRKEDVLNLAVAVDTSGSISDLQLATFFNEIKWIWKNGAKVTVIECDTRVTAVYPFKGHFTGEVHGRGGTSLEPALIEAEGKYDGMVFFTDFYAPKITKRYKLPILWVLTTELTKDQFPYPWGKHIKIECGKAFAA